MNFHRHALRNTCMPCKQACCAWHEHYFFHHLHVRPAFAMGMKTSLTNLEAACEASQNGNESTAPACAVSEKRWPERSARLCLQVRTSWHSCAPLQSQVLNQVGPWSPPFLSQGPCPPLRLGLKPPSPTIPLLTVQVAVAISHAECLVACENSVKGRVLVVKGCILKVSQ